jgi:uncharacterized membrane protein
MSIRTVPASRGWDWISQGFALFRLNPLIWIVILIIYLALLTLLNLIPFLGSIAALILQPVLSGGLMMGCKALEEGEDLRVEHLFDGFSHATNPLVVLGIYTGLPYMLVMFTLVAAAAALLGLTNLNDLLNLAAQNADDAMSGAMLVGLLGSLLLLPIAMATWFAPALIVLGQLSALDAMKASFSAGLNNMWPFLLYGLIILVLGILAAIPAGLGLLVLAPTLIGSVYAGYRDIFADGATIPASP